MDGQEPSQAPRGMPKEGEAVPPKVEVPPPAAQQARKPSDDPVGSVFLAEVHEVKDDIRRLIVIATAALLFLGMTAVSALYLATKIGNPIGLPR